MLGGYRVTGAERARRRWKFPVTPSGIERRPNVAKQRENSSFTEKTSSKQIATKRVGTVSGSKVAKLAGIAANAVRNYDLTRAIEVLEELRRLGGEESP
jgi:hypothetical protein